MASIYCNINKERFGSLICAISCLSKQMQVKRLRMADGSFILIDIDKINIGMKAQALTKFKYMQSYLLLSERGKSFMGKN